MKIDWSKTKYLHYTVKHYICAQSLVVHSCPSKNEGLSFSPSASRWPNWPRWLPPPWEGNHGSPLLGLPGNRSKMAKAEFEMELNNSEW